MFKLIELLKDDNGATAIEYGLIASLVAIVGVIAFTATGNTVLTAFTSIADTYCTATGGSFSLTTTGDGSCTY